MRLLPTVLAVAATLSFTACSQGSEFGAVDEARLLAAEDDPDNWLSHGRTYAEQRFSPLADINIGNVSRLDRKSVV